MKNYVYLTLSDKLYDKIKDVADNKQISVQQEIIYTLINKYIEEMIK